jgi:DivIVA domain-containing protein
MTDETFHLTPHDIRAQEFQRTIRGYEPTQVESFKQRVAEEFDRVLRDRVQLEERLKGMLEQLRSFRERERAMNEALVAAQAEAARLVERAGEEEQVIQQRSESAVRQLASYLASFRALLERHQNELAGLEAYLEPEQPVRPSETPVA